MFALIIHTVYLKINYQSEMIAIGDTGLFALMPQGLDIALLLFFS
jgi:hypothetical protein